MCLLERLERWDDASIRCVAISHRDPDNPLRAAGRLHAVHAVEYAAQAMALHGGLRQSAGAAPPTAGYIASVRDVRIARQRLDDLPHDLDIRAERLAGDEESFIYSFVVSADGQELVSGRIAVQQRGGASGQ
jgi:predicted hotdog family 3-hydroxylacyl-ACP dehydratase